MANAVAEIDNADAWLLSEYVRIEEAVVAAGKLTGDGTSTFVGRQLEGFGDLDSGVNLGTRAGEIHERFRAQQRQSVERVAEGGNAPERETLAAEAGGVIARSEEARRCWRRLRRRQTN